MQTREQVIKRLKELSVVYHTDHILHPKDFLNQHDMKTIDCAIVLLEAQGAKDFGDIFIGLSEQAFFKNQEPRVMTLEEVKALPDEADVWLEEFCCIVVAATISNHNLPVPLPDATFFYGIKSADYNGEKYMNADYGKEWRCWTSRPTDVQREATPWENLS